VSFHHPKEKEKKRKIKIVSVQAFHNKLEFKQEFNRNIRKKLIEVENSL